MRGSRESSAEPPNVRPSALMKSRRPTPRVSINSLRRRAHVSSTSMSWDRSIIAHPLHRTPFRQRLRRCRARKSEYSKPDENGRSGRDGRVGCGLHSRPDLHRHRLADAAEDEGCHQQFMRGMNECENCTNHDPGRDDR